MKEEVIVVIDAHAHIIVREITRQVAPEKTWRPRVFWEDGYQVVKLGGREIKTEREFVDIDLILEAQLAAGVSRVLLSPISSLMRYDAEPDDGLRSCRIQNQALAKLARDYPDRVSALGTVPMQDPQLASQELRLVMKEQGLQGVVIGTSIRGVYLGDDIFREFWTAAEETNALVFVHPTTRGFDDDVFKQLFMWNTVGNPLETTIAASHLIMMGVMEDHPNLKILLAHGGGAILALRGRLRRAHSFQIQAQSRLKEPLDVSLKRFYFDTLTYDAGLLKDLVAYVGAEHVLLGSDYPFDMGVQQPAETLKALGLSSADNAKILGGNAAGLLGL